MPSRSFWGLAILIAFIAVAMAKPAQAQGSLRVVPGNPEVTVSGFNVYAPTVVTEGSAATLIFGGWLTESQKPSDALYRCHMNATANGWGSCDTPRLAATPGQVKLAAQHLNDPAVSCEHGMTLCRYAVTVCTLFCGVQSDSEIWVGRSNGEPEWSNLRRLLVGGAAEPAIGVIPGSGDDVIYFTQRGDYSTIFAQRIDWDSLTALGSRIPVVVDRAPGAVSSVAYLQSGRHHILVWNRFERPVPGRHGRLGYISIAYSIATASGKWTPPRLLLVPPDGLCALLTPALAADPVGGIDMFVGTVATLPSGDCRLSAWSKQIVRYRLETVDQ